MDEIYSPDQNTRFRHHLGKIPNYIAPGIRRIDYDYLFSQGVCHLVFDIDNTLTTFGARRLDDVTIAFLLKLKARPEVKSLRLATNSIRNLAAIKTALNVPVIQPRLTAFKPLPGYYRRIVAATGASDPATVAMIGDKLVQDIWGANAAGLTTVLVQPLGQDNWLDRLLRVRQHERRLLRRSIPHHHETWF